MVVLHDYVVDNVPGVGRIDEGDVSDELKEKALEGDVVLLKAKNSWGKKSGPYKGYLFMSRNYVAAKMLSYMVHKDGLTDVIKKRFNL